MIAAGAGGVIVNVASTAAFRAAGTGRLPLRHLQVRRARAHAEPRRRARRHGIRVLAVAPTVTLTPGLEAERAVTRGGGIRARRARPTASLGRVAVPDDIARVVVFCASDLSLMMTGSTLLVDGGELAG